MVTHDDAGRGDHETRSRANRHLGRDYLGSRVGAPPVPPAGGYRRDRRFPSDPALAFLVPQPAVEQRPHRPRPHALGWIALSAAVLFALALLGVMAIGGVDPLLGATVLLLQLVVLGAIVAAFFVPRARMLAAAALTVALVCNVGTAAAAGSVMAGFTGGYGGLVGGEEQSPWASYPGMKGIDPDLVLDARSLEEVQADSERLSQRIRDALSDEFGFTWVKADDGTLRNERNGYGGESLQREWRSPTWITEQPVRDHDEKLAVMGVIDDVLWSTGEYYAMGALNDPEYSGRSDVALTSLYGSADPRTQVVWEWATSRTRNAAFEPGAPSETLFYAMIDDLENDTTGDFTARADPDDEIPDEGVSLLFIAPEVLSEPDRDAFEQGTRERPPEG